jgi:hypothetical protein
MVEAQARLLALIERVIAADAGVLDAAAPGTCRRLHKSACVMLGDFRRLRRWEEITRSRCL